MSLLLWRYSRPAWTRSCAACSGWPCFSRGVGLDDPQMSLPTPTVLWFCNFLPTEFASLELAAPGNQLRRKAKNYDAQVGKSTFKYKVRLHLFLLSFSTYWFLLKTPNWITCNHIKSQFERHNISSTFRFGYSRRHYLKISWRQWVICILLEIRSC